MHRTGGTRVDVPPLGHATLATHPGPLRLRALAVGVDPDGLADLLQPPHAAADPLDALRDAAAQDGRQLGRDLVVRAAFSGVAGAAVAGIAVLHRPGPALTATATGTVALLAAAARAAAGRRPEAWRDPQLTGLLERAPLVLGDLRTAPERVVYYRDALADIVRTATGVYQRLDALPGPPPPDAIRLLHVSDIHLHPASYALAALLAEQYDVAAVVDTGDLVDWGTPAEYPFAAGAGRLGVPYVFVKGNHDSAGVAGAVAAQPGAVVLDPATGPVEVAGLRFAGMPDPRHTPDKTTGDDAADAAPREAASALAAALRRQPADIALVHDPSAARRLAGLVPLVLAGHTHRRAARRLGDDTVLLVQGTSGGSGLRGVQQEPPTPLSFSVLHLDRDTHRLWGVDEITLGGLGSVQVDVRRRTLDELLATRTRRPAGASR